MTIDINKVHEQDCGLQDYLDNLDKSPNGNLSERLTWDQIATKYPDQWVGLDSVKYLDNNEIDVESAIVKYHNRSREDIEMLQALGLAVARYTTPEDDVEVLCYLV